MARGTNQKLKLYYLVQIMLAKTDEEHSLTMPQIIQELGKYDITAERKSIYPSTTIRLLSFIPLFFIAKFKP